MTAINRDRVYLMWKAQRKVRAMCSFSSSPAYVVARRFGISCAQVREIVKQVREEKAS